MAIAGHAVEGNDPLVSVVVGSYNRRHFLRAAIDTVRLELRSVPHELIVVDGGSDDGALKWLLQQKDIITIVQYNRGKWRGLPLKRHSWGYFMNLGFRASSARYICMISDDCLLVPGAIRNGIAVFESARREGKRVGAIAFYWRNWPEQKDYWTGRTFGNRIFVNHGLYLKEALQEIGFIDDRSYSFYHADGDLCLRLFQAGYDSLESPKSFVEHFMDANQGVRSANMSTQKADWEVYIRRWGYMGEPEKDWHTLEYFDNSRTAEKYWRKELITLRKRRGLSERLLLLSRAKEAAKRILHAAWSRRITGR